jgi:DMSO reductase anchor subunit
MQNSLYTKKEYFGLLLLGISVCGTIGGAIYALVAEDSYPGLVIAVTSLIAAYIVYRWLIFLNSPKE